MTCEDCGAEMPCRAICDDCIEAYTASDNSDKAELRRERDEALDEKALLRVANANLLAELRQATERAEKAEAERDEARAQAERELDALRLNALMFFPIGDKCVVFCPGGRVLCGDESAPANRWWGCVSDLGQATRFDDPYKALMAGRALPWWEVKA